MKARPTLSLVVSATAALGMFAQPAFAYLDPSTGSMILSAIVGIFATVGLALKTYWYKFKSFFRSGDSAPQEAVEPAAGSENERE